jgi:hypothetical protein
MQYIDVFIREKAQGLRINRGYTIPAIAFDASMFLITAPWTPSNVLWPSFNIPCSPLAAFRFIDFAIFYRDNKRVEKKSFLEI